MRFSLVISGTPCDLFDDETIQLTRQVKDLTDLSKVYMDYTQDFELPSSPTNDALFANYFEENIVLSSWSPYFHLPAEIYLHSMPIFEGQIEFIGVNYDQGIPRSYKVVFYGQTKNALTTWGEQTLGDLDWSAYDHVVDITSVIDSWTGSLLGGDVLYPIAIWSTPFTYSTTYRVQNNIQRSDGGFAINDLRPAIRLTKMIETCFDAVGGVSGSLLSLSELEDVYVAPMAVQGPLMNPNNNDAAINASTASLSIGTSTQYTGPIKLDLTLSGSDPLGTWDAGSSQYVVPFGGQYKFKFSAQINSFPGYSTQGVNFLISRNGSTYMYGAQQTSIGLFERTEIMKLTKGDRIAIYYTTVSGFDANNLLFEVLEVPQGIVGTTLNLGDIMPTTKISDFVNGFLKMFNGIVVPDGSGGYELHNLDDWLDAGTTKNWTEFIDVTQINHEKMPVPRHISMEHEPGKDVSSVRFRDATNREYGSLLYKPDVDYSADPLDVKSIFNVFMPSRLRNVNDKGQTMGTTDLQFPVMLDKEGKPIQQPFTMFYYAGLQGTSYPYYLDLIQRTTYPLISPFKDWPTTSNTYSLNFGMESSLEGDMPTNTLYQRYFSRYVSRMFSTQSRKVTMTAVLPVREWLEFNLNDTIAISGNYYKVQSIRYDMLNEKANLELLTYPDVDIIRPTSIGNSGGWTDAVQGPDGVTVIRGDVVAKDITNTHVFGGGNLTGVGMGVLDLNQTFLMDYTNIVFNLVDRWFRTQLIAYNPNTTPMFIPAEGDYQIVPLTNSQAMGDSERFTFDTGASSITDAQGGQFRVSFVFTFEHSGNIGLRVSVLVDGAETLINALTLRENAPVSYTGVLEVSAGQAIQLAVKDPYGVGHPIDVQDVKLQIEAC